MGKREALMDDSLEKVAGGSFAFNTNNGKVSVGNESVSHIYQVDGDPSTYGDVLSNLNGIMNGEGSDDDKNAAIVDYLEGGIATYITTIRS